MQRMRLLLPFVIIAPLLGCSLAAQSDNAPIVRVFLLAGQSNMEGKGAVNTLPWLGEDEVHGHLLETIQEEDGGWVERDDVWIWYLGRKGSLSVGFGSEGSAHGP